MVDKKKKLLLIGPLPPPLAGPEVVTKNLTDSAELNAVFDVYVLNTTVRKNNSEKGKIGIQIFIAYFLYVLRLLRILILVRPQLVFYLPTSATLVGWVRDGTTIFLSALFRKKVAILMQGGHFRFFYDNSNRVVKYFLASLLNKCCRIFVQAKRLSFQFEGIVPDDKLKVFYNFINNEFIKEFGSYERKKKNVLNLLFVGHLTTAKGYCDLLEVLPTLTGVEYSIMGSKGNTRNVKFNQSTLEPLTYDDSDEVYEKYIVSNGLETSVKFLGGAVKGTEKINTFKDADIFVLPSYSEGFSTAILEAMAAGLPIVATSVGAAPEIIENGINGYIVAPGDISTLSARIQQLIDKDELRADMGALNLRLCKDKYNADVVIHELVSDLKLLATK